jgi:hypothetical protein
MICLGCPHPVSMSSFQRCDRPFGRRPCWRSCGPRRTTSQHELAPERALTASARRWARPRSSPGARGTSGPTWGRSAAMRSSSGVCWPDTNGRRPWWPGAAISFLGSTCRGRASGRAGEEWRCRVGGRRIAALRAHDDLADYLHRGARRSPRPRRGRLKMGSGRESSGPGVRLPAGRSALRPAPTPAVRP